MTDEIRRALEHRIAASAGSAERQARIRKRIAELEQDEAPVTYQRRWPRALVLALVLVLVAGTGLAAGIKLNLFKLISEGDFGDRLYSHWDTDQVKLQSLSEKGTLIATSSVAPEGVNLENLLQPLDAYYDGEVLLVGYLYSYGPETDVYIPWTPTEEELEQYAVPSAIRDHWLCYDHIYGQIGEMVQAGRPAGFIEYLFSGGTRVITASGDELYMSWTTYSHIIDDHSYYGVMQFISPLPDEIRGKDRIEIQWPWKITPEYFWFDGEHLYHWFGEEEDGSVNAVIGRDRDVSQGYYRSGAYTINGAQVTAEASLVSPYLMHLEMHADQPIFQDGISPWHWVVTDDAGQEHDVEMSIYDDADHKLALTVQAVIFKKTMFVEEGIYFYDDYGEDGLFKEVWVDMLGELPETISVVLTLDETEEYRIPLYPVE